MYYYKQVNESGEIVALLSWLSRVEESETQIEITQAEYEELRQRMFEDTV